MVSSVVDTQTATGEGEGLGTDCREHIEARFEVQLRLERAGERWVDAGSTWTAKVSRSGTDRNSTGSCTGSYQSEVAASGSGFALLQLSYAPSQPAGPQRTCR